MAGVKLQTSNLQLVIVQYLYTKNKNKNKTIHTVFYRAAMPPPVCTASGGETRLGFWELAMASESCVYTFLYQHSPVHRKVCKSQIYRYRP